MSEINAKNAKLKSVSFWCGEGADALALPRQLVPVRAGLRHRPHGPLPRLLLLHRELCAHGDHL